MIGSLYVLEDGGLGDQGLEHLGNTEIIDAPTDISFAGVVAIAPPGIVTRILVKMAKRIDEASFHVSVEAFPFFRSKACVLFI